MSVFNKQTSRGIFGVQNGFVEDAIETLKQMQLAGVQLYFATTSISPLPASLEYNSKKCGLMTSEYICLNVSKRRHLKEVATVFTTIHTQPLLERGSVKPRPTTITRILSACQCREAYEQVLDIY